MKPLPYLLILIGLFLTNLSYAQDTVPNRIDTLICSDYMEEFYFYTPYDTMQYDSEWMLFGEEDPFSIADSIITNDGDSLLLFTTLNNGVDSLYIDTFFFSLRFTPEINFEVPITACFDGDSLTIKNLTNTFGDYTTVDYKLEGEEQFATMDSLIKVFVDNGDSTALIVNYFTLGCSAISDTIDLKTDFQPISNFPDIIPICFDGSTKTVIINNSVFDTSSSMFSLQVDDLITFNVAQDSFDVFLPTNGDQRDVYVQITQESCTTIDTFQISNKLQPDASFDALKTCENEFLSIDNLSSDIASNSTYNFTLNNITSNFTNSSLFTLIDTLADGTYTATGVVDNANGCIDSFTWQLDIDSVTYVSFTGLDDEYCESQDISNLQANINAGLFQGQFIEDLSGGQATFTPTSPAINIPITLTYTNSLQCTDSDTQTVPVVHPKPQLVLDGLKDAYCELDPATDLVLTDTLENAVSPLTFEFEIIKDGQLIETEESLTYNFDPLSFGSYIIRNTYTDDNGCFDIITNGTTVNPLPNVAVDSLTVISPGSSIEIGNLSGTEPNVNYTWSDESDESTLIVSQPGIYIIEAENDTTGCIARDTAKVEYDVSIETGLVQIQISPNPTQGMLTISIEQQVGNILLVDIVGEPVSINGTTLFSTDQQGKLVLDLSNHVSGYYYLIIPQVGNFLIVKL